MTTTAPRPTTKPSVRANFFDCYRQDALDPNIVNGKPLFDLDMDLRPMRPPTPTFDAQAEIRTMAARLRWLCDHDNDAPRYMAESIDALVYERDVATDIAEDAERAAEIAAKDLLAAEEEAEDAESHIGKLIELIDDMSDTLTPDEQDEPENVGAFMEGYDRRLAAIHQYLTDNMLRK